MNCNFLLSCIIEDKFIKDLRQIDEISFVSDYALYIQDLVNGVIDTNHKERLNFDLEMVVQKSNLYIVKDEFFLLGCIFLNSFLKDIRTIEEPELIENVETMIQLEINNTKEYNEVLYVKLKKEFKEVQKLSKDLSKKYKL